MPNETPATPSRVLLNEGLCKQLIQRYFSQVYGGARPRVVLHALLHEVYAQGVAAGARRAAK